MVLGEYLSVERLPPTQEAAQGDWRPRFHIPNDIPGKFLWDSLFRALLDYPPAPMRPDFQWVIAEVARVCLHTPWGSVPDMNAMLRDATTVTVLCTST
jgi:hypothetical protein